MPNALDYIPDANIYDRPQYRPHMRERVEIHRTLPKMTVENALVYYYEYIDSRALQSSTVTRIKMAMRRFKRFASGYLPEEVHPEDILDNLLGLTGESPRRYWSYWNQFYSWVWRTIGLDHNPLIEVHPGRYVPPIRRTFRFLLPEDMDALRTCPELMPYERMVVNIMHDTAARPIDLIVVKLGHIDWERRKIKLYRGKTGTTDWGLMSQETVNSIKVHLSTRRANTEWLFDYQLNSIGRRPHRGLIREALKRAAEKAFPGDPYLINLCTPLTMRHTACSDMARSGLSALEIAKIMGHSSTQMVERYVLLVGADAEAAATHFLDYLNDRRGAIREARRKAQENHGLDLVAASNLVRRRRGLSTGWLLGSFNGKRRTA